MLETGFNAVDIDRSISKLYRALKTFGDVGEFGEVVMSKAAELLKQESQMRCPVDTGDLESAHRTRVERTGDDTNAFVFIDEGSDAFEYAKYANAQINPNGPKRLGRKSQEKQASSPVQVGGGFMERAMRDNIRAIRTLLVSELRDEMNRRARPI